MWQTTVETDRSSTDAYVENPKHLLAKPNSKQGTLESNTQITFSNANKEKKVDLDRALTEKGQRKYNKACTPMEPAEKRKRGRPRNG